MLEQKDLDVILRFGDAEAKQILTDINGVVGVVLSTVDGFEIAYAHHGKISPARISAMSSSISAISSVVAQETSLVDPSYITIYSDNGFIQIFSLNFANANFILSIVADTRGILAQVTYRGKRIAEALLKL